MDKFDPSTLKRGFADYILCLKENVPELTSEIPLNGTIPFYILTARTTLLKLNLSQNSRNSLLTKIVIWKNKRQDLNRFIMNSVYKGNLRMAG